MSCITLICFRITHHIPIVTRRHVFAECCSVPWRVAVFIFLNQLTFSCYNLDAESIKFLYVQNFPGVVDAVAVRSEKMAG